LKNFKIIEVLESLDKKEFKRLGEFVSSPYFNKNQNVVKLYGLLSGFYPDFSKKKLNAEVLFSKLFPAEKYDYHKLSNVVSDLYKLTERFLIQVNIEKEKNSNRLSIALINELRNKELYRLYEQKFERFIEGLDKDIYKDEVYYYTKYELYSDYLYFAAAQKPNTELNLVQTAFDNLYLSSMIGLMKFYILMIHENNQTQVNYDMPMFDEVLKYAKNGMNSDKHNVQLIATTLLLVSTKEPEYFFRLNELKEKYIKKIKFDDLQDLYVHLCSFCAYMVNFKREESFNRNMFTLYKEILHRKLMTADSFLYPNFMNYVKIACRVREYEFAEKFIEEYKSSIIEEEKENVLSFCYATIENSKGNYSEALRLFTRVNFQNFLFKVQVKISVLGLYYKLGLHDEALGAIDSFKHYVKREKNLVDAHRSSYYEYLRLMTELIRYKEAGEEKKEFLLKKIQEDAEKMEANPFRVKSWIMEEADRLEEAAKDKQYSINPVKREA